MFDHQKNIPEFGLRNFRIDKKSRFKNETLRVWGRASRLGRLCVTPPLGPRLLNINCIFWLHIFLELSGNLHCVKKLECPVEGRQCNWRKPWELLKVSSQLRRLKTYKFVAIAYKLIVFADFGQPMWFLTILCIV